MPVSSIECMIRLGRAGREVEPVKVCFIIFFQLEDSCSPFNMNVPNAAAVTVVVIFRAEFRNDLDFAD